MTVSKNKVLMNDEIEVGIGTHLNVLQKTDILRILQQGLPQLLQEKKMRHGQR